MNYDDYIDPFEESKEKEALAKSLNEELKAKEELEENLKEEQVRKETYLLETEEKGDKIEQLHQTIGGLFIFFVIIICFISVKYYKSRKEEKRLSEYAETIPLIQNPNYFHNGHLP